MLRGAPRRPAPTLSARYTEPRPSARGRKRFGQALRRLRPDYELWRDFPYEYERDRLAVDLINGSELLRRCVDDAKATPGDLDALTAPDEASWREKREAVLLYK